MIKPILKNAFLLKNVSYFEKSFFLIDIFILFFRKPPIYVMIYHLNNPNDLVQHRIVFNKGVSWALQKVCSLFESTSSCFVSQCNKLFGKVDCQTVHRIR